jgi:hypothetical protein
MIEKHYDLSKLCLYVFLGSLAFIALVVSTTGKNLFTSVLVIINGFSFYLACWFAIKAKARSGWWIFAPLIFVYLGAFIIWFLEDKSPPPPKEGELPLWAR